MCYWVAISTTSPEDLSSLNSTEMRFTRPLVDDDPDVLALLAHPHRWTLESRYGGCSCHYRHVMAENEMHFGPPEEWFEEDSDDVESTMAVYDLFARLIAEGHEVDVVDVWSSTAVEGVHHLTVPVSTVPREAFRFFEGYKFDLTA